VLVDRSAIDYPDLIFKREAVIFPAEQGLQRPTPAVLE
jgi:hypothetical protein